MVVVGDWSRAFDTVVKNMGAEWSGLPESDGDGHEVVGMKSEAA